MMKEEAKASSAGVKRKGDRYGIVHDDVNALDGRDNNDGWKPRRVGRWKEATVEWEGQSFCLASVIT